MPTSRPYVSLLREVIWQPAPAIGFHGNFSFPIGCPRQTKLPANLPIVLHSLPSSQGGVITTPGRESCKAQQVADGKENNKTMHSTIFQVGKTRMEKDDHLSPEDISDYDYGKFGIDWIGDEREDENGFECLVNTLPGEMFSVNKDDRSVTVRREGVKTVLNQMVNTIRDIANNLNERNITNWLETYNLQNAIENYTGGSCLFYYQDELMGLNQFIKDVAVDDCTTLHVGAMLDYHI